MRGESKEEHGFSLNMMSALLSCFIIIILFYFVVIVFALDKAKSLTYQ